MAMTLGWKISSRAAKKRQRKDKQAIKGADRAKNRKGNGFLVGHVGSPCFFLPSPCAGEMPPRNGINTSDISGLLLVSEKEFQKLDSKATICLS
jgi:hypothetical protein